MIRRIELIKRFGVFGNFQWPAGLPEFRQFNLLYGWNYSGKTTLSRAFRCFEQKAPHADFADAQLELRAHDGAVYELSAPSSAPVFRVFNSDFVQESLRFADGSAEPILVLGTEDISKQEDLKAKRAERDELRIVMEENQEWARSKTEAIEGSLTRYARDLIKVPLAQVNYDKRRFEPVVQNCESSPAEFLLDNEAAATFLQVYRSTEKKLPLAPTIFEPPSVAGLKEKTAALLARTVAASGPLPRLKDAPDVESWVGKGRVLHAGKVECQFCGRALPPDLLTQLAGHFSADYDDLMDQLRGLEEEIQTAVAIEPVLNHTSEFYPELAQRFGDAEAAFRSSINARVSALEALEAAVRAKQAKAFTALECPLVDDPTSQLSAAIETINETIAEHNERAAAFDEKQKEAFSKLENHYAAQFVVEEQWTTARQQIALRRKTAEEQAAKLADLDSEVLSLERDLSESVKGAERINELLADYFGTNELRVVVSPEQRFQIVRGTTVARNLSEGEKTAIAFAYFITRVQDGRHALADTRVVVDDPISSLDANHLFNTYALIKTQLGGCRQLFISTHSFEFFNLVREWAADEEDTKKPQANWKTWGIYLVRRTNAGAAALEEIPKELLKFRSEYHYLFSRLYQFDNAGESDFDGLLSLPNIVRRFMEAFGGIMIPLSAGLKGKMPRIFPDEVVRERVWKFMNHYSHNATITRSLTIPDTSECKAVVQACLKAVEAWDAEYFEDLVAEVA